MSNDRVDSNFEELVEETAEELAVNTEEISEEIEKTIANPDGDPCNRSAKNKSDRRQSKKLIFLVADAEVARRKDMCVCILKS
jgi:hypothetical protein